MTSKRPASRGSDVGSALDKAVKALVEQAQSVLGALAAQPSLQPIPVRVRSQSRSTRG